MSVHVSPSKIAQFNTVLFSWYRTHRRPMAWRETKDPYRILVSELMLQQTQVDRVRQKYEEFLGAFPDVYALAKADRSRVLRVWSGLGYNRRAKYLHECAKMVVAHHDGVFPDDYDSLIAFPGIGRSTAGALLAFAFDQDTPMIDTNIRRILTRVFFSNLSAIPTDKELYEFAQKVIPEGRGRDWNYAMLDVGALRCTARHHSSLCPFHVLHGEVSDFVYKKPQKKFVGSRRAYRGKILQYLVQNESVLVSRLPGLLGVSIDETHDILSDLAQEELVHIVRGRVRLPQ